MSQSRTKRNKRQKFLAANPDCYFCDGTNRSTTIDHVPPRACFPDGYAPEGFEFAACEACNKGADKQDQIFGFYSMLLDFGESKTQQPEHVAKFKKLKHGIQNNYPDALPDQNTATPVHSIGSLYAPSPVAILVNTTLPMKKAAEVMGKKLTHALYLRESGKRLTSGHRFLSSLYQPQRGGTETLTTYFVSLLPDQTIGQRSNIKPYGDRFRYISGFKAEQDFFMYAAQFGSGLIVWGMVLGPNLPLPEGEPLRSASWITGACGPGA